MSSQTKVVLLCCGSFNPITNMHLRMFELARDALHRTGRYRVVEGIISPVNDRYGKKELTPANHRAAMLNLALKSNDWIRLDTWEMEQDTWSETCKVLRHHRENLDSRFNANQNPDTPTKKRKLDPEISVGLCKILSDRCKYLADEADYSVPSHRSNMNINETGPVQLKLLCGADLLESFGTPGLWKEADLEEILGRYGLVCISRGGSNPDKFIYESDMLTKFQNNIMLVTEWIQNEISSTRIRRALRRGESVKYLVQDSVIEYIRQHGFYGVNDNKYVTYPTPAPSRDDLAYRTTFDDDNNRSFEANFETVTPDVSFLSPNQYRRVGSEDLSRSDYSSTESLGGRSPRLTRRSLTCGAPDITGLVRRVKNMRVALTPETCV